MGFNGVLGQDILEEIVSEEQVKARIKELAATLVKDYQDSDLLMVCVLNGASVFYINLMMEMDMKVEMNYIRVSSYGAELKSSGTVRILYDLEKDITGKDVLLVEDIIDSGNTLYRLKNTLLSRGAKSVRCCSLLDKPSRREVEISADYVGFVVPDKFLVGYGLDYDGKYRNLPFIGTLKPEIYR